MNQPDVPPRIAIEMKALATHFPGFQWWCAEGQTFAEGLVATNSGGQYAIRVALPADYPSGMPTALVTHPHPLTDAWGQPLTSIGESAAMHLLGPREGLPVICHFPPWSWSPLHTIYKVVIKSRLWLEAYELHLRRGSAIDTWLGHTDS